MSTIWQHMTGTPYLEEAFRARDITTSEMRGAIREWYDLYYTREPTKDSDPCQRMAYTITSKLTNATFGDRSYNATDTFAKTVTDALAGCESLAFAQMCIGGASWIKPVCDARGVFCRVVSRDNVLIFGRDAAGNVTDIGCVERSTVGGKHYTLLERRTVDWNGYLTFKYKLFVSDSLEWVGAQTSLQTLPQYADLQPEYTFSVPVWSIGMAALQNPRPNTVDGSPDSVSIYAPAVGLIRNIDKNEAQINGEFDRAQSRIFVADSLLRRPKAQGGRLRDNIFVTLNDPNLDSSKITSFSPQIREQSFLNRKQAYLKDCENLLGLKRGILSDAGEVQKTATEITSSAGEYALTVGALQQAWETTAGEVARLCGVFGGLYGTPGAHEITLEDLGIDWGNGVLYDRDKNWAEIFAMVSAGILKPELALAWRYGLPADTPADIQAIREKYMPEIDAGIGQNVTSGWGGEP